MKNKLFYPAKEIAPYVESFMKYPPNKELMKNQGWLISLHDTDTPDEDYIRGERDCYFRIEANDDYWEALNCPSPPAEVFDDMARDADIIVDKHGVVRGFKGDDMVYMHNANLPKLTEEKKLHIAEVTAIIASNMYEKFYNGGEGVIAGWDGTSGAYYAIGKMAVEILDETAHIENWDEFMKTQPQMGWDCYILELAQKKFNEKYVIKKFKVTILRTSYQWAEIEIEAEDRPAAILKAEETAGNYNTYKEKDAEYSVEICEEKK